jgi:Integrase core domain
VWQLVALYKPAQPSAPRPKRLPNPDERPQQATAPHQVWFVDVRYLVQLEGHGLYSILLFDGYSRALVGAGCFDRQHLSRVVHVCRQAIARWGAPDAIVSDNAGVFLALSPWLQQLGIRWAPMARGHPWQHLAEGGFSVQRRMLDADVTSCTDRERVYRQHAPFVQDYQFWGHWAHKRIDAQGRIYSVSPEVILGHAHGRPIEPARLRRVFRLRQLTRQARQYGQIRLHNLGIYGDQSLWGQPLDVWIYDEALRIEQAEHLLVAYPCVYDTRGRRITTVDEQGRQPYREFQVIQLMFWTLGTMRTVWRMPPSRWSPRPRRGLHAHQQSLFGGFAP